MPEDAFTDSHRHLGLVVVEAPFGQQARLEAQVRRLADILIENGAVDRLNGRIDRRRATGRIEAGQIDVKGDCQRVGILAKRWKCASQSGGNDTGRAGSKKCTTCEHDCAVPLCVPIDVSALHSRDMRQSIVYT